MAYKNFARFTINGTASEDANGNRGFDATASQVLTITLEDNPAPVAGVKYELYNVNNPDSPLNSINTVNQVFANGETSITLTNPNASTTITVNAGTEISSYMLRATTTGALGSNVFERMIVVRGNGLRLTVPGETNQYSQRGMSDALSEVTLAMLNAGSSVPRFSRVLYVDPGTASAARDGSVKNPFLTINEANTVITTASANTAWVVQLQPGYTYALGTAALPVGRHVTYTTGQPNPLTTDSISDTAILGTISVATGFDLCFRGVSVGPILFTGSGRVTVIDSRISGWTRVSGTAGAAYLYAVNSEIVGLGYGEGNQDNPFNFEAVNCVYTGTTTVSAYNLLCRGCSFAGAGVIEARLTAAVYTSVFSAIATLTMINVTGVCSFYLDEVSRASADAATVTYSHLNTSFTGRIGQRDVTRYVFKAEDFLLTNTADWAVNSSGSVGTSATFPFQVGALDGTTQEGFGFTFAIPDGKTMITFEFWYTRGSGSGGTSHVLSAARKQVIGNGGSSFSWSSQVVVASLPAVTSNTYWRRYKVRTTLAALSMEDRSYQVLQLLRTPANVADDMPSDDLILREVIIELT